MKRNLFIYKFIKVVYMFCFYKFLSMRQEKNYEYLNTHFFFFLHIIHSNKRVLTYFAYLQKLTVMKIWLKFSRKIEERTQFNVIF